MLDWLIVGGGVHGTLLSRALVEEARTPLDRIRVLDPHPEPLACFRQCAAATGLDFLRSSVVHHLDGDPMSLRRFALSRGRGDQLHGIYQRPAIGLFVTHCETVMERLGLHSVRVCGVATDLDRVDSGAVRVDTSNGALTARRVVLALGSADQPLWPSWAEALRAGGSPVRHVFEPGFRLEDVLAPSAAHALAWREIIVLGGGLSAVQLALWLAQRRPGAVTLLARHSVRVQEFDSDARWMGPRGAREFARIGCRDDRRTLIGRERQRGSVPGLFAREVERQAALGTLTVVRDEVVAAAAPPAGPAIELELQSGARLRADGLLLATGFHPRRPGGAWLDRTIARLGLEYAACGYPVVDASLRWGPGLYVTGPLAELEIGPVARNILGARLAGERLVAVATG